MALVLSMRQGDCVSVGNERVRLVTVRAHDDFDVTVDGQRRWRVTDKEAVELLTDVFVSAGPKSGSGFVRVVFDAPAATRIMREQREDAHVG